MFMKKIIITENEKKEILKMHNIHKEKNIILEGLDYTKPIITSKKLNDTTFQVSGFINFKATKSDLASQEVMTAINDIVTKLQSQGYQATGLSVLTVNGGASNSLNGATRADVKNDPNNPLVLTPAVNNLKSYPGEINKVKNVGYAKARAEVLKNALVKKFPPTPGAKIETKAYIIDTGGLIDEKRNKETHPVPGQQATFTAQLVVKQVSKPISAEAAFKQTKSHRDGTDSYYYTPIKTKIGSEEVIMCAMPAKNSSLGLMSNLPDLGLTSFEAKFTKGTDGYTITNNSGKDFTNQQWIWIYWYLTNEANKNKCQSFKYVKNLPSWLNGFDLNSINFGATRKDLEYVHDRNKHDLVK